jgi:hypothetical protein
MYLSYFTRFDKGGSSLATKIKKTYSVDSKIVDKFQECCKQNGKEYSESLEFLMKLYIEKQGNIMLDDIYAPRLNALFSRTMEKAVDRIAGMVSNVNVDILASMFLQTAVHKKTLLGLESTFDHYLLDEILNPARGSLAQDYKGVEDANNLLTGARNAARKQIAKDIKARVEAKKEEKENGGNG